MRQKWRENVWWVTQCITYRFGVSSTADLVEVYLKATLKSNKEGHGTVVVEWRRCIVLVICALAMYKMRCVWVGETPLENCWKYPGLWLQFELFSPHIRSHSFHFSLTRSLPHSCSFPHSLSLSLCPQMVFALLYRAELRRASLYRHNCQTNTLRALLCARGCANNRITG